MAIRIVTDSVADLPPAFASANEITVIPAYVIIGNETFRDGLDIFRPDRFYERLGTLPRLPTTSQPTMADFQEVYQRLLDQGHQIVSIHVSSKLSGTVNSATQAKAALGDASQIEIVDSQSASAPQGLLVLNAAEWAREMSDFHELARRGPSVAGPLSQLCASRHAGVSAEGRSHRKGAGVRRRHSQGQAHSHHPGRPRSIP